MLRPMTKTPPAALARTLPVALCLAVLAGAPAAPAFAFKEVKQAAPAEPQAPGAVPRATLGWDLIADVREEQSVVDGQLRYRAIFGEALQKLDGGDFTIGGWIIPLEQSEKSAHFLLSALSPTCPFCPPPGPADLIEVRTTEPVQFSYEMVTLKGRLKLMGEDPNGLYFRLEEAKASPTG